MGSRVQSTVGCFLPSCFLQISVAQVLVGLQNLFINNFVFLTSGCEAVSLVFIIIISMRKCWENFCMSYIC